MHRPVHVFLPADVDEADLGEAVENLLAPWYVEALPPDQDILTYDWYQPYYSGLPTANGKNDTCRLGDLTARQHATETLALYQSYWEDMERLTADEIPFQPFSVWFETHPDTKDLAGFRNQPFLTQARQAIPFEEWKAKPELFFRLETGGYDDYLAYHTLDDVPSAWIAPGEGWNNCDLYRYKTPARLRLAKGYRHYRDNADPNSWIIALDCHF